MLAVGLCLSCWGDWPTSPNSSLTASPFSGSGSGETKMEKTWGFLPVPPTTGPPP